ncbi:MAG: hypothetical protein IPP07_28080 [Holophagales bacterium]|nr:hypothetical protein [Holophagales bacterium]MBK9968513.1 hypothetical protein [Holophagales bacterium]
MKHQVFANEKRGPVAAGSGGGHGAVLARLENILEADRRDGAQVECFT